MNNDIMPSEIIDIERQIISNLDLIEVAQKYCESESEHSKEASTLCTIMNVIINNQKNLLNCLNNFYSV